jgi:alpha-methylacyl-CoA racemase
MTGEDAGRSGPLTSVRVVEIGSLGPGPFCSMMLADMGADVLRIDRVTGGGPVGPGSDHEAELLNRGRPSVGADLKNPAAVELVLDLAARADILIEGFRPGVAERLGIGPQACYARNPRLVYGRMTGYGQEGPSAQAVGHDLNYLAACGVLSMIGRKGQPPTPPLNLVADIGGGGLLLAFGLLAALVERERSGQGQVVDAAMIDGAALLAAPFFAWAQTGQWLPERGMNMIDSGAPYYDAYETLDGRWISVAAVEPRFYGTLLDVLGLDPDALPEQNDRAAWPELKEKIAAVIRTRTRDAWCALAAGREACIAPVLTPAEVADDPHLSARGTFRRNAGILQPAPAPRFGRTPGRLSRPPARPGEHTLEGLLAWGIPESRVYELAGQGALSPVPSAARSRPRRGA